MAKTKLATTDYDLFVDDEGNQIGLCLERLRTLCQFDQEQSYQFVKELHNAARRVLETQLAKEVPVEEYGVGAVAILTDELLQTVALPRLKAKG
jgi:hypothetical protein